MPPPLSLQTVAAKKNREPLEGIFAFLFLDVLILKRLWV